MTSIESLYLHNDYNSSLGTRAAILFHSKELIEGNWLFGVGTGDNLDAMRKNIAENHPAYSGAAEYVQHMHNEYFSAITQFGVIGLLSFLYIAWQLIVYRQDDRSVKNMQIILAVAILFFSLIDIYILGLGALVMSVTLVALSLRKYIVTNVPVVAFSLAQFVKYVIGAIVIELVSRVS